MGPSMALQSSFIQTARSSMEILDKNHQKDSAVDRYLPMKSYIFTGKRGKNDFLYMKLTQRIPCTYALVFWVQIVKLEIEGSRESIRSNRYR